MWSLLILKIFAVSAPPRSPQSALPHFPAFSGKIVFLQKEKQCWVGEYISLQVHWQCIQCWSVSCLMILVCEHWHLHVIVAKKWLKITLFDHLKKVKMYFPTFYTSEMHFWVVCIPMLTFPAILRGWVVFLMYVERAIEVRFAYKIVLQTEQHWWLPPTMLKPIKAFILFSRPVGIMNSRYHKVVPCWVLCLVSCTFTKYGNFEKIAFSGKLFDIKEWK